VSDKSLLKKIESHTAVVGIMGMGYVGLPLVRTFCGGGYKVIGYDVDPAKVKSLNAGKSYIEHIPSEMIRKLVNSKKFKATADHKQLGKCDAILICVPTPLSKTRDPDMTYVIATAETIAKVLRKGQLIVLESTTYPGTTREVVKPVLEQTGLKAGRDFFLAFSPEREDPGREDFVTETIPKVVGGMGPKARKLAATLYGNAIKQVVPVSSCEIAEAAKILENVYRCVNIAMVNELKTLFDRMGIDVWEVINAAKTKPFGFSAFCIPIDPFYLSWKARQYNLPTRFIELAGEINRAMPEYVVERLMHALNDRGKALRGAKVLVLGLAYKKDVDDIRESPSIELIELLRENGANVDYNDPHIPTTHKQREHDLRMKSKPLSGRMLASYDAVLISTDHSAYDYGLIVKNAKLVIDTRNACDGVRSGRKKIVKA
jgi:UDP-N-acetyl-D-glucosamine dehydrogenase